MFEDISYKKKFFTLIVLLIVLSITAYKRSFRLSIDAYKTLNSSKSKLADMSNSQQKIANLQIEVAYLDDIIGKEAANADLVQQEILNTLTKVENEVALVKLEEIHKAENDYFTIYTNRLILTGSYNNLLATAYAYEKKFEYSRVISISYYVDREPRSRIQKLYQQIIFQNYEKIR